MLDLDNSSPRLIENEIRELKHKLLDMSELVQLQLEKCCAALRDNNIEHVRRILKKEKDVDKFDNKIQKRCERIIALYQPVAIDLRFVFSSLKINLYLEAIGDAVSSIAYRLQDLSQPFEPKLLEELHFVEMQELTMAILREALQAYFQDNTEASKSIFRKDDRIDEINVQAQGILVQHIQHDPKQAADYLALLLIIKSLEKIGDNAVSIAEESLFHIEGVVYRHTHMKVLEAPEGSA